MKKNNIISLEFDIKRDPEYKYLCFKYKKDYIDIKSEIYGLISIGKNLEANYNIIQTEKCKQEQDDVIKKFTDIYFDRYQKIYNELLELKKQNIIMQKVLKDNNIKITIKP